MAHKHTFKQIKEHIRKQTPLKLTGLKKDDLGDMTLTKFLDKFFNDYNQNRNTLNQNSTVQTVAGLRRTIEDIYRIVIYYFPNASLSFVYKRIIHLIANDKVGSAICKVLHKRVYRGTSDYESEGFLNSAQTDEFGIDFSEFEEYTACSVNDGIGWGEEYDEDKLTFINI